MASEGHEVAASGSPHEHHYVHGPHSGIDMTWVIDESVISWTAVCVVIAVIVSLVDISGHAQQFHHPKIQRATIRILFMIPLYALFSYLSLILPKFRFFLCTIRDTYESFVLYQFLALLVAYCGGEATLLDALSAKRYKGLHPAPCCCLPMFKLDHAFFLRCKRWVLQYALVKPLISVVAMVLAPLGWYDETDFSPRGVFLWAFIINNFSITWCLWYLVLFHQETEKELDYCKPVLKFVAIKAIIFFAYWQTASLGIFVALGIVYTGDDPEEREHVNGAIQDFLMCVELVPISIVHHLAFGVEKLKVEMEDQPVFETGDGERRNDSTIGHLDAALDFGDVFKDTIDTIFSRKGTLVGGDETEDAAAKAIGGGTFDPELELGSWARTPSASDSDSSRASDYAENEVIHVVNQAGEKVTAVLNKVLFDEDEALPYCVVCGRSDRVLVKRKSGYKCAECVGMKKVLQGNQ